MLNRPRLMQEIAHVTSQLFLDTSEQLNYAYQIWETIIKDSTFPYKCKAVKSPWMIPTWQDRLEETIYTSPDISPYAVLAVDGSQIYPDRHQNVGCYLINVGTVQLRYGMEGKRIILESIPYVFSLDNERGEHENITDVVNCRREEYELSFALTAGGTMQQELGTQSSVVLLDGSLIFWHLEGKEETLKEYFVACYCALYEEMRKQNMLVASYISFPRSKELINLIRLQACDFKPDVTENKMLDHVVDAQIARRFLAPYERTIIFQNHAPIVDGYPAEVRPYFFYINTGYEIARIEIPHWIATNPESVSTITQVILNQSIKGRGYPVCLAEAHEQAVVKGPDRDFFYHVLQKVGIEQKQHYVVSQKSLKKRGIGI